MVVLPTPLEIPATTSLGMYWSWAIRRGPLPRRSATDCLGKQDDADQPHCSSPGTQPQRGPPSQPPGRRRGDGAPAHRDKELDDGEADQIGDQWGWLRSDNRFSIRVAVENSSERGEHGPRSQSASRGQEEQSAEADNRSRDEN